MALATTAAAIAGVSAAAAYLDGKYHIRKDIVGITRQRQAVQEFEKAGREGKHNLFYRFSEQVERLAPTGELCIWSRTGCYDWQETFDNSLRYGHYQHSAGVKPGDLVAFYLQNSPEFMFAYLGSWAIGSAPALINYNLGGDALVHCLKISGAKVLVVDWDDGCVARIEEVRNRIENELGMKIVILDEGTRQKISAIEPTLPPEEWRKDTSGKFPMCLLYTSGSTGMPKCCAFEVQRAFALAGPRINAIGLKAGPNGDRWYICMPLYHGTGNTTAVCCMITGVQLAIGKKFSTTRFWDDIRDSQSTAFVYVGETARYLLSVPPSPRDRDHKVKVMFGNGLRPDVWRRFRERFGVETVSEFFNSTEGVLGFLNVNRGDFTFGSVGHYGAIARLLIKNVIVPVDIDHETGDVIRDPKTGYAKRNPYHEGGEIIVNVPSREAFVGYWQNEGATDKKFLRDVFKKDDLWYRSGDALRMNEDGLWYFMDRLGDTYRWKSENVSTAEVAVTLGNYPGIGEAIVYGVEVPGHDGKAGCASIYVPPHERATFDLEKFLLYAQSQLPKYAVPVFLRIVLEMSPMHNNKQNKVPLKKEGIDVEMVEASAAAEGKVPDKMMWHPPAVGLPGPNTYVDFTKADLERLKGAHSGQARL